MNGADVPGVVEKSPAPIVIYDAEYVIRYANEAAADLAAADEPAALVGEPISRFVPERAREVVGERMRTVVEGREAVEARELELRTLDGETIYAEVAGGPVTYDGEPAGQAVLQDVTELKRREQEARRERDRFVTLFEHLPNPVVHGEVVAGEPIVRRANPAFEETFGYDAEAVVGENLDRLTVPDDRMAEAGRLNERMIENGHLRAEVRRETADGIRDFRLDAVLRGDDGREGYAIYTDITERKQREAELERKNERLDSFASVVSHDLRNPLHLAKGQVALLRDGDVSREEAAETLDEAVERMERRIDDLLTLARRGETIEAVEPVDLRAAAADAWAVVQNPEATIEIDVDRTVAADPARLRELLENLFRNAVEHGTTSRRPAADDAVEHGARRASDRDAHGDAVEHGSTSRRPAADDAVEHGGGDVTVTVGNCEDGFYVADDGCGIPPEERDRVFEAGYTRSDGGSGFGLAIVREIAGAHGWTVAVTDAELGGARFEFDGVEPAEPDA